MKKLFALLLIASFAHADTALITIGADGRPLVLPIPNSAPPPAPAIQPVQIAPSTPPPAPLTSAASIGSLPPAYPSGYIYYTLPGPLKLQLVTPWSAAILAEGYDFIGKEAITQGYFPLFQYWKVTGVFGGGINGKAEGSPMGGAIVDLATVPISASADFHIAVTGGYNINAGHALAVLSGSVQFLK